MYRYEFGISLKKKNLISNFTERSFWKIYGGKFTTHEIFSSTGGFYFFLVFITKCRKSALRNEALGKQNKSPPSK